MLLGLTLLLSAAPSLDGQQRTRDGDSLQLAPLHREALARDPRQQQFELLNRRTGLRLDNLAVERLPSIRAEGLGQYQSDVFDAPFSLPGGAQFPSPSNDSYDARVVVEQALFNPTISPRQQLERAALAESEAQLHSALHRLRAEVNEAFFAAAILDERRAIVLNSLSDLDSRLQEARVRVREGVTLPGDTAAIRATQLERQQDLLEIAADRASAVARLAELIGRPVSEQRIVVPDLTAQTAQARMSAMRIRARPEYATFARGRDRLLLQEKVVTAGDRPTLSAFGRAGYGRPGLNPVSDEFDSYWVAGVQVRWSPFSWGRSSRERQVLAVERSIVTTEESAFTSQLTRQVQSDLAAMDRLDTTLALDTEIIGLRERVEQETRLRFQEGVVTATEYLDRSTDVLEARLAAAAHRVELAAARARFLTTLGLEIR
jgi:outer membrane protein TolC